MPATAVVGINWGDEGKGRVVDYLAGGADAVIRFQGGSNAGHTVVNDFGTFRLHLLPSGVFSPRVRNVLGAGMVVDPEALTRELSEVEAAIPHQIDWVVSGKASIVFPFHRAMDGAEEERLRDRRYGSTRRGIAPAYGDRYLKKAVRLEDLGDRDYMRRRVGEVVEWANLLVTRVYGLEPVDADETVQWLTTYADPLRERMVDTGQLLADMADAGEHLLFEAQLGALRDVDVGIYPYTSSSSCLSSNVPLGGPFFGRLPDAVVGVVKAYSTCVGEGPMVTEMEDGEEAARLREAGSEYGAATGRPRRVGHFDAVASRYGVRMQQPTELALTKLDVLSGQETVKICTAYQVGSGKVVSFPHVAVQESAEPLYEERPGWSEDIAGVRRFRDLPQAAREYVLRIEELLGCRIRWVSVGPEREAMIDRGGDA